MGRHLPAARGWILSRADGLEQHLLRSYAERQTEGPIAVIRIDPVLPRPQNQRGGNLHGLVSGAANLEKNAILALERDLAIIEPAGQMHRAIRVDEGLGIETSQPVCSNRFDVSRRAHYF